MNFLNADMLSTEINEKKNEWMKEKTNSATNIRIHFCTVNACNLNQGGQVNSV